MIMQDQKRMLEKTFNTSDYEKPALIVKHFLIESNITIISNLDPTATGENPVTPSETSWWD